MILIILLLCILSALIGAWLMNEWWFKRHREMYYKQTGIKLDWWGKEKKLNSGDINPKEDQR